MKLSTLIQERINNFNNTVNNKNIMLSDKTIPSSDKQTARIMAKPLTPEQRMNLSQQQLKEEDERLTKREEYKFSIRVTNEIGKMFSSNEG